MVQYLDEDLEAKKTAKKTAGDASAGKKKSGTTAVKNPSVSTSPSPAVVSTPKKTADGKSGKTAAPVKNTGTSNRSAAMSDLVAALGGGNAGGLDANDAGAWNDFYSSVLPSSGGTPRLSTPVQAGMPGLGILDGLLASGVDARQENMDRRAAEGYVPPPDAGAIDWGAIMHDLGGPMRDRTEQAGGAPFEGGVDWGGIGAALFSGQSAEDRDHQLFLERNGLPADYSAQPTGPSQRLGPRHPAMSQANQQGYVVDPVTGSQYHPSIAPQAPWAEEQLTAMAAAGIIPPEYSSGPPIVPDTPTAQPAQLADLAVRPVQTYPVDANGNIDMAPDPAPIDLADITPSAAPQAPAAPPPSSPTAVLSESLPPAEQPSGVWDAVVDGGSTVLSNTPIGGIVQSLFPEFWDEAEGAVRGLGDSFNPLPRNDPPIFANGKVYWYGQPTDESERHKRGTGSRLDMGVFTDGTGDGTGDGTDDGGDGDGGGGGDGTGVSILDRVATFPTMPPYRPGFDPEWSYFNYLNQGADPGYVDETERPGPATDKGYVDETYRPGPDVGPGYVDETYRPRFADGGPVPGPRAVRGPGGPTGDAIPARIDGGQEARLSDGEFVLTADAVRGAGDGDMERGIEQLLRLNEMLARKGR